MRASNSLPSANSVAEETLALHFRCAGLEPEREFQFCPTRKWRFDFAFPSRKVAVEVEGGIWTQGRHTRGSGYVRDLEKYNSAALAGWKVLRYSTEMVLSGLAINELEEALKGA